MTDYYREAPSVRPFLNVTPGHPYLHEILEVESTNHGLAFSDQHYGGDPWATKFSFIVLAPQLVCYNGYNGALGTGSFHTGQGPGKRVKEIQ